MNDLSGNLAADAAGVQRASGKGGQRVTLPMAIVRLIGKVFGDTLFRESGRAFIAMAIPAGAAR